MHGIIEYFETLIGTLIFLIVLSIIVCGAGGWYLGDRYDLPTINVEW